MGNELKPDISELKAGAVLDALVAEEVMGWKEHEFGPHWYKKDNGDVVHCWSPSTSIAHAWEVVEKLDKFVFTISRSYRGWWARFQGEREWEGFASGAPLAICRAALMAKGR